MKKNICLILLTLLIICPISTNAKTLSDLKRELADYEANLNDIKNKQELTSEQTKAVEKRIHEIRVQIQNTNDEMVKLTEEVKELEIKISDKDAEIKRVMQYLQVANGESAYIEYLAGAQDFTDFIYRGAIVEQLSSYNKELITSFTNDVNTKNNKKKELENKSTELQKLQGELNTELQKLKDEAIKLSDSSIGAAEQIKLQKEMVEIYVDRGCKDHEDISTCGREILPSTTAFFRPLISGYVTSEFGYRCDVSFWGGCHGHSGIDMSERGERVNVYAVGTGMVAGILYRQSCGGNMVFVHHRLNGQTYTSAYYHLRTVNVSKGDIVSRDTVIGLMGGDPDIEYWDKCSTGSHIHLTMAYGLYLSEYYSWNTFNSNTFNPRLIINVPPGSRYFHDRLSKY